MWHFSGKGILARVARQTGNAFASHHKEKEVDLATKIINNFKKHPELTPIIFVIVFPLTMAFYSLYHASHKPDVRFSPFKRDKMSPHEEIGSTEITKLYTHDPSKYRPIKELEVVKKDLKRDSED